MSRFMSFIAGVISGALVGSVTALLLAPTSGEELRQQSMERADAFRSDVQMAYEARVAQLEAELARLRKSEEAAEEQA
jgi:gas vesicle protein